MIDLTGAASWGLIVMAVWGTLFEMEAEYGGERENRAIGQALERDALEANLLITCPNGNQEFLAPTIRLPDGTEVAMVEPKWIERTPLCFDDHFIIRHPDGRLERWDVGYTEKIPDYSHLPRGIPNSDRSVVAIPRQITDFAKLRAGDDEGGGVGSLLPSINNDNAGNDNSGSDTSESGGSGSTENVVASSSGGGGSSGAGAIAGGVIVAGALLFYATGGGLNNLSWSPSYTFTQTDFGSSYYYGARMDYAKENVRAYWYGGQSGTGSGLGDWSYGSGGSLTKGKWRASYSGTGNRESMTGDMWLSMYERRGIWSLETGLGGLIGIDERETTTNYFVRAQTEMKLNDWTMSQSANWNGTSGNVELDFVHNW